MGASGEVRNFAVDYLRWSMPGLVAMLLIFAGTGVLRGLQDTRTPLFVAAAGFTLNVVLNLFLVYGLQLSVAGSAIGTSIAQWAMALVYVVMVQRNARNHGVSLLPDWRGIRALTKVGSWLMLRTLSLRIAILATVVVVTAQGPVNLAAHQLAMTVFTLPGVRPRRPRHCRAGADRKGTRCIPPRLRRGSSPEPWSAGVSVSGCSPGSCWPSRHRGRACSSRPTPRSGPRSRWRCGCSPPGSRSPAMFLSSTAC